MRMRLIIVSGMSGSGKSVALHTLEDEGYYCVDNLPGTLLPALLDELKRNDSRHSLVAVGIDARSDPELLAEFGDMIDQLRTDQSMSTEVLFLDTEIATLLKRFSETRRKHPLTAKGTPLTQAIEREETFLLPLRERSDLVIDTSRLNLHQLRQKISEQLVRRKPEHMAILIQSFGFKFGQPSASDFVFDVRCLPNPYWKPALRSNTGLEQPVIDFLCGHDSVLQMHDHIRDFLSHWIPVFEKENRAYLTVSIGCTGGRHRSVFLSSRLAAHFAKSNDNVTIRHRELTQEITRESAI